MTTTTMPRPVHTPGADASGATFSGIPFGRLLRCPLRDVVDMKTRERRFV